MSKLKKTIKKITNKVTEISKALYERYFSEDTHLKVHSGNRKTGKGIFIVNLLPGCKPIQKKDGTLLTNVSGTCTGCCSDCEKDCYAIRYVKLHHNTCVIPYADNTLLARYDLDTFFNELQQFIDRNIVAAIRYHSAGEIPSYEYLLKMVGIAIDNPNILFYAYTKRYSWVERYEKENGELPNNLTILVSIWKNNYDNPCSFPEFILDDGTDPELKEIIHCPAVDEKGHETGETCSHCKMCLKAKKGDKICVYKH